MYSILLCMCYVSLYVQHAIMYVLCKLICTAYYYVCAVVSLYDLEVILFGLPSHQYIEGLVYILPKPNIVLMT